MGIVTRVTRAFPWPWTEPSPIPGVITLFVYYFDSLAMMMIHQNRRLPSKRPVSGPSAKHTRPVRLFNASQHGILFKLCVVKHFLLQIII